MSLLVLLARDGERSARDIAIAILRQKKTDAAVRLSVASVFLVIYFIL